MITHKKFILASSSKSRYKILKNTGLNFQQISPMCDEEKIKHTIKLENKKPEIVAKILSFEKARSISIKKKYMNKNVVGCDTIIYLNKRILDKAKNIKEAKRKLKTLSGKKHKIISALTICRNGKKIWQRSVTTEVKVRKLSSKQISFYLKKTGNQILQSVGCYQIESLGPNIIEEIKGDFFNVMGLPLFTFLQHMNKKK